MAESQLVRATAVQQGEEGQGLCPFPYLSLPGLAAELLRGLVPLKNCLHEQLSASGAPEQQEQPVIPTNLYAI